MKRDERIELIANNESGVTLSLSADLLICAVGQLGLALQSRTTEVSRTKNNHYSPHSIGSLVLLMTAFDAWLAEALLTFLRGRDFLDRKALTKILGMGAWDKYREIPKAFSRTIREVPNDLKVLTELRDHIVHFAPRPIVGNVPADYRYLDRKGLLLSTGKPESDFLFEQKLECYRVAYWAWSTVEAAAMNFADAIKDKAIGCSGDNFSIYRQICPPEELVTFDRENGIT